MTEEEERKRVKNMSVNHGKSMKKKCMKNMKKKCKKK
jgi:hypothetical protein